MGDRTSKAGRASARGDRPGIVCARIESRKQKPVARIARRLMDVPAARRLVAPSLSRPSSVARASLSIPLPRPAVVVSSSRSTSDGIFHLCTFCSAEVEPLMRTSSTATAGRAPVATRELQDAPSWGGKLLGHAPTTTPPRPCAVVPCAYGVAAVVSSIVRRRRPGPIPPAGRVPRISRSLSDDNGLNF
jgi:hypothetical protein